jgi:hypothetical protein
MQMEREAGNHVEFVKPKPGFVLKTTRLADGMKTFINIAEVS